MNPNKKPYSKIRNPIKKLETLNNHYQKLEIKNPRKKP